MPNIMLLSSSEILWPFLTLRALTKRVFDSSNDRGLHGFTNTNTNTNTFILGKNPYTIGTYSTLAHLSSL